MVKSVRIRSSMQSLMEIKMASSGICENRGHSANASAVRAAVAPLAS